VKGNFLQLLKGLCKGLPLPLAWVDNRRSLIYRGNLVDALVCCVHHRFASGRTYLVSDGEDLSTRDLVQRLGKALGRTPRLWPLPQSVLWAMGWLAGQQAAIDRLLGSLQIDSQKIRCELGWHPPFSVDRGLAETAAWYRGQLLQPSAVS
jgi:nucleoside-diphosphate-sugar epimerase